MAIDCEVIPRPGATPDELKSLGSAVLRWYVRECRGEGIAHSVDTEALIELLNGRLPAARVPKPSPAYVSSGAPETEVHAGSGLNGYELRRPNVEQLREALATARRPAALLCVRERNYDRARIIASLRESIPAELVADVRVDGRSWDVED
jgi:hypothetical protein